MKKTILSFMLTASMNVSAESMQITISQEQIDNLAIHVAPLKLSQQVPLLYAPAKVVVPADHELLVSSPQPGLVTQLLVNIGDRVEKGQLLAQLNSPELVALQQQYLTASSELNLSALEHGRDKKLLQEGVIAERRWQETQAVHSSKAAKADESRQFLAMAGMSAGEINTLTKSRKLHSQLSVRAPISGVVLDRSATVGTRLDMQAPLYRIADLSQLWLEINIPQERLQSIRLGDRVQVAESEVTAEITLLGQSINPENQTVLARAVVDGRPDSLRVGQHLNVQIVQSGSQKSFKVPNTAIAKNSGHAYVFVRNTDGFAVTEVTVVGQFDQESLIDGPLNGNENIAVQGAVALKANWLGLGGDE